MRFLLTQISNNGFAPFGMVMEGRNWNAGGGYRYGFNGLERDDDISGFGNSYTSEYRQYDSRLGRWFSLDPITDEVYSISPYIHCNDNPISLSDEDGRIGVLGFLIAGGIEMGGQMIANKMSGKALLDLDWGDVAIAACAGAVGCPIILKNVNKISKYIGPYASKFLKANLADGLQAIFDIDKRGIHVPHDLPAWKKALYSFGADKFGGLIMSKVNKKILKVFTAKKALINRVVHNNKKALKAAENSLENEKKKTNINNRSEIDRKTKNVAKLKVTEGELKIEKNVATVNKQMADGVSQSSGGGVGNVAGATFEGTILGDPDAEKSYTYMPQKTGTDGYYYLDREQTRVYSSQNHVIFDYNANTGTVSNERSANIDVSKPILVIPK